MSQPSQLKLASLCGFLQSSLEIVHARSTSWNSVIDRIERDAASHPRREQGRAEDAEGYASYGGLLETYRGMFWEVYLWLQLGIEVGLFPRDACVDLMNHLKYREVFPTYAAAFQKIGSLFPGALQIPLLDGFRRNVFFTTANYPPFIDAQALRNALSTVLALQVTTFSDQPLADLTAAVTFMPTRRWESIFDRPTDFELLETQFAGGPVTHAPVRLGVENLIVGFLRAIAYISHFRGCFDSLDPGSHDRVDIGSDVTLLERRCKEISFWRLNFHREDIRVRFLQIGRRLAVDVSGRDFPIASANRSGTDLQMFELGVLDLMGFWTNGVQMEISGSAAI